MLLEASGFQVEAVTSVGEALEHWPRIHPDLAIVDLHMPGEGMRLLSHIHNQTSVPVIVLSADHEEDVKVAALDAGAEDYISKPFGAEELLARIRVVLRRRPGASVTLDLGSLLLSPAERTVSTVSGSLTLTPTEYDLLAHLGQADGFVPTSELLKEVWGPAYQHELEYVRAYIRRLRRKLDLLGLPQAIESRPGLGYRLNDSGRRSAQNGGTSLPPSPQRPGETSDESGDIESNRTPGERGPEGLGDEPRPRRPHRGEAGSDPRGQRPPG